jgi:hypothetical protein
LKILIIRNNFHGTKVNKKYENKNILEKTKQIPKGHQCVIVDRDAGSP